MKYEIYSGSGNDFVMINNLDGSIAANKQAELTIKLCTEQFRNIDGVIFVDKPSIEQAAVRMSYYNRDGSFGAMCGNGARCTVQYAIDNKFINEQKFKIEALNKLYAAEIISSNIVKIGFPPVNEYKLNIHLEIGRDLTIHKLHWMNVGSEHIIVYADDIVNPKVTAMDEINVSGWGSLLRFHESFQPKGANVNFVKVVKENEIRLRTYERGVERETLACGTGIISSAIVSGLLGLVKPPVRVKVQSGEELIVNFKVSGSKVEDVSLQGSAKKVYGGEI